MFWGLKLVAVWFSIDILVIATSWYAVNTIKKYFPEWWERVIACEVSSDLDLEPEIVEVLGLIARPDRIK
jgi:hypothetical protein